MPFPSLGEAVPRRGNRHVRKFWRAALHGAGWDVEGTLPDLAKFVVIGAPHTSNWDFVVAMPILWALGVEARWIGKHTIFRWPFARLLRYFGGMPVKRSEHHGSVERVIDIFNHKERLVLAVAPEGTRKRVTRWKTGFYHIAVGAGVPIVPAYFDYPRRRVGFGAPFSPTGDVDADIQSLRAFYTPYAHSGRRPHLF